MAAVVALLLGAWLFSGPDTGRIVVTVSGPGGKVVDPIKVLVDGEQKCDSSPCTVADLAAEKHAVRVTAPGYEPVVSDDVQVTAGQDEIVSLKLVPSGESEQGAQVTGLAVPALGKYLRLFIDGEDKGALPVKVTDLQPGSHTIRIEGNERYSPYQENITLQAGEVLAYEPKLKVKRGLARVEPGANAQGARVVLTCPGEGETVLSLPTSADVEASKPCRLTATKDGYQAFTLPVDFGDGQAEKSFSIALEPEQEAAEEEEAAAKVVQRGGRARPRPAAPKEAAAGGGQGKVSVGSTPPGMAVVVGGRPVGRTPVTVSAPSGRQTVMVINSASGQRKVLTVQVQNGKTASAFARF